ncbi:HPF/RaiA family ribosome-associated protein [Pseudoalteromonas rubra]|uniref:HPF/RaiA family ribosome-associated protein n=1 Tax=Pseudoalteromonas rubra TaxID=43658 RepID=UPI000F798858|nr:HPF/RaiA family ribosome-associated protein [Pseudoalteromonas rubra]
MWVDVFSSHSDTTEAEDNHVDAQIRLMLGRYAGQIDKVEVYLLTDEDMVQTSPQYHCTIRVGLKGFQAIEVKEVAGKASDAIDACAHRAKRYVKRALRFAG